MLVAVPWYEATVGLVRRRCFSLLELITVLSLMALITGAGTTLWLNLRSDVHGDSVLTQLRAVAGSERQAYAMRGRFITDTQALAARSDDVEFTQGTSSSPNQISIATSTGGALPVLILAAATADGQCQVLVTSPDGAADSEYRFTPDATRSCTASSEAP